MKRSALAAFATLLLTLVPLASAGAQWDVIVQASPHAVTRTIEVPFPQLDFRTEVDPQVAATIDGAIQAKMLVMLQDLISLGNVFGTSEVTVDAGDVLSVTMTYSGYHPPMAHPMHLRASVTADLRTGQIYRLKDLFIDDSYIEVISKEVAQQIVAQDISVFEEFKQIRADQDFFLKPDALVIYYQVYDLAPYVFGFPQFEIPLDLLVDIAVEGGPIKRLAELEPELEPIEAI